MRISRTVRTIVVAMTCFGFLSADVARAAGPAIAKVRDVALQSAGVLHGQVVDAQGRRRLKHRWQPSRTAKR